MEPQSKFYEEQGLSVSARLGVQADALGNKAVVAQGAVTAYKGDGSQSVMAAGDLGFILYVEKLALEGQPSSYWKKCSPGNQRTSRVANTTMFMVGTLNAPDSNLDDADNLAGRYRAVASAGIRTEAGWNFTPELRTEPITFDGLLDH